VMAIYANSPQDAVYWTIGSTDKKIPLTGASNNVFQLSFDAKVPVGSFWSVTLYDSATGYFSDNKINRYRLNPSNAKIEDGKINITFANKDDNYANWLPAPTNKFYFMMRFYMPGKEVLTKKFKIKVTKV
jgi:hypothetical protein